jgi:inosine-uridine nucleoside N-ribohydrolase
MKSILLPTLVLTLLCQAADAAPRKVIIDTDIGDDIDDAFAVALALRLPELDIIGFSTAYGETAERARILDRMLTESGHDAIPVAIGPATPVDSAAAAFNLNQRRYGDTARTTRATHPQAIDFILEQIDRYPDQVTLIAIGPLTNVGALIDRSPASFRRLHQVVMMGGFIAPVAPEYGNAAPYGPVPEWNIKLDIRSAQKLLASGVPLTMMPIDSTLHLKLEETRRRQIFTQGSPLTDALTLLYQQWGGTTPTLFDPMTLAYLVDPTLCPVEAMRIQVDASGYTRVLPGKANAQVCLHSDPDAFMRFFMQRLLAP